MSEYQIGYCIAIKLVTTQNPSPHFPEGSYARALHWYLEHTFKGRELTYVDEPLWFANELMRFRLGVAYAKKVGAWDAQGEPPEVLNRLARSLGEIISYVIESGNDLPDVPESDVPPLVNDWHECALYPRRAEKRFLFRSPPGLNIERIIRRWFRQNYG